MKISRRISAAALFVALLVLSAPIVFALFTSHQPQSTKIVVGEVVETVGGMRVVVNAITGNSVIKDSSFPLEGSEFGFSDGATIGFEWPIIAVVVPAQFVDTIDFQLKCNGIESRGMLTPWAIDGDKATSDLVLIGVPKGAKCELSTNKGHPLKFNFSMEE